MAGTRTIIALLITIGALFDAAGQLPPFRFLGVPERPSPTGTVTLMNDRILIQTDDETSTWDSQRQRCYVYHRSTQQWTPLMRFDDFCRSWLTRWRLSFKVLDDSLVSVRYGTTLDSIAVWNVDADSSMCLIGNHGGANAPILHPLFGVVQYYQNESELHLLRLHITPLANGVSEYRPAKPPGDSQFVKKIIPRKSGGFWLQTEGALWWTEQFDSYVRVTDLRTDDLCMGGTDGERVHVLRKIRYIHNESATLITISSPTQEPFVFEVPALNTSVDVEYMGVDLENRLWFNRSGAEDGIYVVSPDAPQLTRVSRFDKRSGGVTLHIGTGSWMAAHSYRGLMVSTDNGRTWQHVNLPHPTSERIDADTRIQPVEGGGVVLTNKLYYHRMHDASNFEVIGTVAYGTIQHHTRWYHRNNSWLRTGYVLADVGDSRGTWREPNASGWSSVYTFSYSDTIYVRWLATYPDTAPKIARWAPGSCLYRGHG